MKTELGVSYQPNLNLQLLETSGPSSGLLFEAFVGFSRTCAGGAGLTVPDVTNI